MWTLGVGSDRSLGRPKEWNGEPSGFDDFVFKFSNWLSGLPGDVESFLEESVTMAQPIQWATREKVVARGVATALQALIGGKALSCIRHHPEKLNGFEMWRLLCREYKLDTATRKVGLLERESWTIKPDPEWILAIGSSGGWILLANVKKHVVA